MYSLSAFLLSSVSYPLTNFFKNHMTKNIPVKSPMYFPQHPNVQIPFPQHNPIIAINIIGSMINKVKFLICMLHWKSMKHGIW